jgi:hypothetical protein
MTAFKKKWTAQALKWYECRCQEPCELRTGAGTGYTAVKKADGDAILDLVCLDWEASRTEEIADTLSMLRLLNNNDAKIKVDQLSGKLFCDG